MSDLRNAGKYYWHYLKRYWLGFLLSVILIAISTWCIVVAPTYLGRAVEELTQYFCNSGRIRPPGHRLVYSRLTGR